MKCDGFLALILPFWRKMRKSSMCLKKNSINSERIDVYAVVDVYFLLLRQESIMCRVCHAIPARNLLRIA